MRSHIKPRIFICSTRNSPEILEAVYKNLEDRFHPYPWEPKATLSSASNFEYFETIAREMDACIFIIGSEDEFLLKGEDTTAYSDSILFKMGYYMGKLGVNRCFLLFPDDDSVKIPSDFIKSAIGFYDPTHPYPSTAVRTFCNMVVDRVEQLPTYHPKTNELNIPSPTSRSILGNSISDDPLDRPTMESKELIHWLLSKNKIPKALEELSSIAKNDESMKNQVIGLMARHERLHDSLIQSSISRDDILREYANLDISILALLDKLED